MVLNFNEALEASRKTNNQISIKIGISSAFDPKEVISMIQGFHRKSRDCNVFVSLYSFRELEILLQSGKIDVAFCANNTNEITKKFHSTSLFAKEMALVLPRNHVFAESTFVNLGDLFGQTFVHQDGCEICNDFISRYSGIVGASCDRDDWAIELVAMGFGFCFLPLESKETPQVVTRRTNPMLGKRKTSLITVPGRPHSPNIAAFIRFAQRWDWCGVGRQ